MEEKWTARSSENGGGIDIVQGPFNFEDTVRIHVRCQNPTVDIDKQSVALEFTIPVPYPGEYVVKRQVNYFDGGSRVHRSHKTVTVSASTAPDLEPDDGFGLAEVSAVKATPKKKAAKRKAKK